MTVHLKAPSGTGSITLCGQAVGPGDSVEAGVEHIDCPRCSDCILAPANSKQVGGSHYAEQEIQPWDVMQSMSGRDSANMFAPFQWHLLFTALKYVMRAGRKNDAREDVDKAIHYLEKLRDSLTR